MHASIALCTLSLARALPLSLSPLHTPSRVPPLLRLVVFVIAPGQQTTPGGAHAVHHLAPVDIPFLLFFGAGWWRGGRGGERGRRG